MFIFFYIIFIVLVPTIFAEDLSITVSESLLGAKNFSIGNTCNIKKFYCNGILSFGSIDASSSVTFGDSSEFHFFIKNIPSVTNPTFFIAYDTNNKLYLINYSQELSDKLTKNSKQEDLIFYDSGTLTTNNIATETINQNTTPLTLSSINKGEEPVSIDIGNKIGSLFLSSNLICNTKKVIFNSIFDFATIFTQKVTTENGIKGGKVIIENVFSPSNEVTFDQENTINIEGNTTGSATTALIQGDISFGGSLSLGSSSENTSYFISIPSTFLENPPYFLGLNNNNQLMKSAVDPQSQNILTSQIKGEGSLTLKPISSVTDNQITLGSASNGITYTNGNITFSNNLNSTNPNIIFLLDGNVIFNKKVTFNTEELESLVNNNNLFIDGNMTINNIYLSGDVFLEAVKNTNTYDFYVGVYEEDGLGYLALIPKNEYEIRIFSKKKSIKSRLHLFNQKVFLMNKDFLHNKNIFDTLLEKYKMLEKRSRKTSERVYFYIKVINSMCNKKNKFSPYFKKKLKNFLKTVKKYV